MVLLLHEDLADGFADGVLVEFVALLDRRHGGHHGSPACVFPVRVSSRFGRLPGSGVFPVRASSRSTDDGPVSSHRDGFRTGPEPTRLALQNARVGYLLIHRDEPHATALEADPKAWRVEKIGESGPGRLYKVL